MRGWGLRKLSDLPKNIGGKSFGALIDVDDKFFLFSVCWEIVSCLRGSEKVSPFEGEGVVF